MAPARRKPPTRRRGRPATSIRFDRWTALATGLALGAALSLADLARVRLKPVGAADAPSDIPPVDYRRILVATVKEFNKDQIPAAAASVTFFVLLALFPAIGAFVSLYGLFADAHAARQQLAALGDLLPAGGITVLGDQRARLAAGPHETLSVAFVLGFLFSLWSSNAGVKSLIGGLNLAYERRETRSFAVLNLTSLAFTCSVIAFAVFATAIIGTAPELNLPGLDLTLLASVLRWPVTLLIAIVLLSVLYRFAPANHRVRWRWITPGGLFAAVAWMSMSLLFSWYVAHFGNYNRTYGSLGAIVGFMTWIWLSTIVVLFGAELNAEIEARAAPAALAS